MVDVDAGLANVRNFSSDTVSHIAGLYSSERGSHVEGRESRAEEDGSGKGEKAEKVEREEEKGLLP